MRGFGIRRAVARPGPVAGDPTRRGRRGGSRHVRADRGDDQGRAITTQPITPNGAPVTVSVPTAGANNEVDLTFNGSPGQEFSVATSAGTFGNCDVQLSLIDPDGVTAIAPTCGGSSGFLDAVAVDDVGQYFIRVAPSATATGSVKVNLYRITDQTPTLVSGTGFHAALSTPGQNVVGSFRGHCGQQAQRDRHERDRVQRDDHHRRAGRTTIASTQFCGANGFLDATLLPVTGTYQVIFDPPGTETETTAVLTALTVADQTVTMVSGTGVHAGVVDPRPESRRVVRGHRGQEAQRDRRRRDCVRRRGRPDRTGQLDDRHHTVLQRVRVSRRDPAAR